MWLNHFLSRVNNGTVKAACQVFPPGVNWAALPRARQLQMSVSSISQTVSKLEMGLQLTSNRSTRSIGLTEAGKIYYQGCRRMLHEAQDVHEQYNNTPIGTLRIGLFFPYDTKCPRRTWLMLKEYPGLTVNLVMTSFPVVAAVWTWLFIGVRFQPVLHRLGTCDGDRCCQK